MVTETDDMVALGVYVAIVHLAVTAVEVMLDAHLPVTLHH